MVGLEAMISLSGLHSLMDRVRFGTSVRIG